MAVRPDDRSVLSEQARLYAYLLRAYAVFRVAGRCPDFPLILQVQTQSACNGRCLSCPYQAVSGRLPQGVMERGLFERIAEQLASEPLLGRVSFGLQNEPLLDRRIFGLIGSLKSKAPGVKCRLVTNGELLDRFSPREIAGSGLDDLTISLNASSKETYEALKAGLCYERVTGNIESALSEASLRDRIRLSFLAMRRNRHEIGPAMRYWRSRGVRTRLVQVSNRGGALEDFDSIRPASGRAAVSSAARLWDALMAWPRRIAGCTLPFCQMNILFNGDCIICCHDWNRASVVGNARETPLREIWNSGNLNLIRRRVLHKEYDQIRACRRCSQAR